MYTLERLIRYPYLEEVIKEYEFDDITDPLTGLLRRPVIVDYAKTLITKGVPFTFGMLDLDNFKHINDTYGHSGGDAVLTDVAHGLIDVLADYGVAGRFGGDEYLFIDVSHIAYEDKKWLLGQIYMTHRVLRKTVQLPDGSPVITGTTGCVSFPEDADRYDALFQCMDKCLYKGKFKGRNCYIIFVAEKHANLEVQAIGDMSIYAKLKHIGENWRTGQGSILNKLQAVLGPIKEILRVSDLYYVGDEEKVKRVSTGECCGDASDIWRLMGERDMFSSNDPERQIREAPKLWRTFAKLKLETTLIMKVNYEDGTCGYIMCAEPKSRRLWQEEDSAMLYFLAWLVSSYVEQTGIRMD